jgi:hypothetical protein
MDATSATLGTLSLVSDGGVNPTGDHLVDITTNASSPKFMMVGRCSDNCTFGDVPAVNAGPAHRFSFFGLDPSSTSLTAPTNHQIITGTSGLVFDPASAIRGAFDGSASMYFAGQAFAGGFVIERRGSAVGNTARSALFTSTGGPVQIVDAMRAGNGVGVLLLVSYDGQAIVTTGIANNQSATLRFTNGNQTNVAVLHVDSMAETISERSFDLPGAQAPVGFAKAGGNVYVVLNEGSSAVLWRFPEP